MTHFIVLAFQLKPQQSLLRWFYFLNKPLRFRSHNDCNAKKKSGELNQCALSKHAFLNKDVTLVPICEEKYVLMVLSRSRPTSPDIINISRRLRTKVQSHSKKMGPTSRDQKHWFFTYVMLKTQYESWIVFETSWSLSQNCYLYELLVQGEIILSDQLFLSRLPVENWVCRSV